MRRSSGLLSPRRDVSDCGSIAHGACILRVTAQRGSRPNNDFQTLAGSGTVIFAFTRSASGLSGTIVQAAVNLSVRGPVPCGGGGDLRGHAVFPGVNDAVFARRLHALQALLPVRPARFPTRPLLHPRCPTRHGAFRHVALSAIRHPAAPTPMYPPRPAIRFASLPGCGKNANTAGRFFMPSPRHPSAWPGSSTGCTPQQSPPPPPGKFS